MREEERAERAREQRAGLLSLGQWQPTDAYFEGVEERGVPGFFGYVTTDEFSRVPSGRTPCWSIYPGLKPWAMIPGAFGTIARSVRSSLVHGSPNCFRSDRMEARCEKKIALKRRGNKAQGASLGL